MDITTLPKDQFLAILAAFVAAMAALWALGAGLAALWRRFRAWGFDHARRFDGPYYKQRGYDE